MDLTQLIEQMHTNLDGIQPEIVYLEEDGYIKLKRQQIGVRIFTSLSITAKGINFIEVNSMSENSRLHIDALLLPSDVIQGKMATNAFDVFLCYHNIDNAFVKHIGEQLKARGLLPWLDEWELRPGLSWQRLLEDQIEHIKSVAVFVGANGIGPWQLKGLLLGSTITWKTVSKHCYAV